MDKEKARVRAEVENLQTQLLSAQANSEASLQDLNAKLTNSIEENAAVAARLQETEGLHAAAQESIAQLQLAQV